MKRFQRVLIITPSMSKGGAETQLVKVALHLQSNFNEVLIISLKPIDQFNGDLKKFGLNVLFLKNWSRHSFSNLRTIYNTIKTFKPNVVIAFMFIAIIFARLFKLIFRFKLISTIRTSVIKKKWFIAFKVTSSIDDIIVYNSFASKNNFEKRNLVKRNGIVINNGIYLPVLENAKGYDNSEDQFIWICAAHFSYNKDYPTLFKAIKLIKNKNFRVDIIGELNNEVWPFKLVEELGIEDRVNILGFQKNTGTYLNQSDAFVMSSHYEGMANAILEAMAHAKPIVVTDIDGNNELLRNGQCGLLCKKQNEYDMAENMIKVMGMTPNERNQMGQNGRKYIESHFKEEKVMNNWMNLVNEIAE
jgi:glycosyltransferase involved in cell wall biosynthesis